MIETRKTPSPLAARLPCATIGLGRLNANERKTHEHPAERSPAIRSYHLESETDETAGGTIPMTSQCGKPPKELKSSRQIYDESLRLGRQVDNGRPRLSEDDQQREQFGPRGVLGQPDPAKMVPQRRKKTPTDFDPGHTA
jgi:hypothetical protein